MISRYDQNKTKQKYWTPSPITNYPVHTDRRPDLQESIILALPSPFYQDPRRRFSTPAAQPIVSHHRNLIMPSNRSSRQTSTSNLDRHQDEPETSGTRNTAASRKAKSSKSSKALNAEVVKAFEDANGPLLPSPSHDSLVLNTSTTAKR